jgi:hypothetical protein
MKTEVLIPFEPATPDPDWLIKKHAGKRLDAVEHELYHEWLYELRYR